MPENMARLSVTFSKALDLMDLDKRLVIGKRSSILVFVHHAKKVILIQLHVQSLQVCLSQFWITTTLLCYEATWSECSHFSAICMRTGEIIFLLTSSVVAGDVWPNSLHLFLLPSLHLLGNVGASLQREFFTYERLSEEIAGSVFVSLDHVPDYRLRPIIHILPRAP